MQNPIAIAIIVVVALIMIPFIVSRFLSTVDAGTIRLVSWLNGGTSIYKGPGKAVEVPMLTTGTSIPSKAINIDLDIADQTADIDANGVPKPIKVRVLASAIVSVGDSAEMITTAANKFFARTQDEQTAILSDLLTSTGRRAINLLRHDELFSARTRNDGSIDMTALSAATVEDDDRLAIIIKSACSRELQDLGLVFNSLNIKEVQSEVAEARRRQSAVEAKANADIIAADQERRAREAQLAAEQAINDINADAEKTQIQAKAAAEAEAVRIRALGEAQADAIRAVNQAIQQGGDAYLSLRQLELLPQITPAIAQALAQAKLVNISSGGDARGAAGAATDQITGVIQTLLATQLINTQLKDTMTPNGNTPTPMIAARPETDIATTTPPVIGNYDMGSGNSGNSGNSGGNNRRRS